jgi:cobyrinic acid a,c-diamide synthase
MKHDPRVVIAGTHSGVGKTTATLAILAALRERGRQVQPFKAGPDFIDPRYHQVATGRLSRNLDGWMLSAELNRSIFTRAAADADVSIIEGMMGLFDGSSPLNDVGSTAELARQLEAPVILVVDGSAMARSAAAMVAGYARFNPAVRVAGVLFNQVGSDGHYQLLKTAVEQETDVIPVGYLRPDPAMAIPDRHLGLVMAMEQDDDRLYRRLAKAASQTVDLDRIEALAHSCGPLSATASPGGILHSGRRIRIGVAQDRAFCFYYPENLECLETEGAELVPFSPTMDHNLPEDLGMLYLGGGYPELHGAALAANGAMKRAIRRFAEQGGVIYAECGGMMYLTHAIRDFAGDSHEMVGLFPAETVMHKSGLTLGYRTVELARTCILGQAGMTMRGHEFHYFTLVPQGSLAYACELADARGESKGPDGLVIGNVVALYTHLHFCSQPHVVGSLIASAHQPKGSQSVSQGIVS